jgi:sporulation protein YtfJ
MEEKHPIGNLMEVTMSKIREMVDVNTIVGTPIQAGEVTIIPVSKVSFGFASGGSDFATKNQPAGKDNAFGGGSGAGVNINPIGFLVVRGSDVKMLPIAVPAATPADRVIEMVPGIVEKISEMIPKKDKGEKNEEPSEE